MLRAICCCCATHPILRHRRFAISEYVAPARSISKQLTNRLLRVRCIVAALDLDSVVTSTRLRMLRNSKWHPGELEPNLVSFVLSSIVVVQDAFLGQVQLARELRGADAGVGADFRPRAAVVHRDRGAHRQPAYLEHGGV